MEREPRLIGRKYGEEEKKEISDVLEGWSKESTAPLEHEVKKTEEEIRMIRVANELLRRELMSLGIADYRSVEIERVHMLEHENFERHYPGSSEQGFHSSVSDIIVIDKGGKRGAENKQQLFGTILHELVHRASTHRFYVSEDAGIHDARAGYRIRSSWKEPFERNALTALNEVMVETTMMKIVMKHSARLEKEFGITKEDLSGPMYQYMQYAPLLDKIVRGISTHQKRTRSEVYKKLERGQFGNNILPIKDIATVFGKDALRMLSYAGVILEPRARQEIDAMVFKYFDTQDEAERTATARSAEGIFGRYRMLEEEAKTSTGSRT